MNRNLVVLLTVVIAVAAMLLGGRYVARKQQTAPGAGAALSSGNVAGQRAPDFELKDLDGKSVKLADYRGKAVLLNFWATWCGPCKIEMPWLKDLQNYYGPQGLQVIGIAMDDSGVDAIREFTREMGVNYIILQGTNAVGDAYGGVVGLPTTFYVDRAGNLVERHLGLVSKSEIEEKIKKALEGVPAHAGHDHPATGSQPAAEDHSAHGAAASQPADAHKDHDAAKPAAQPAPKQQ